MTDFTDLEAAEREYIPELEEVVKKTLGADHVVAWGPIIRRAATVKTDKDQPVGNNVHVDYTTRWASQLQTRACETHRERFTTLKPSFCPSVGAQRMKFQVKSIFL